MPTLLPSCHFSISVIKGHKLPARRGSKHIILTPSILPSITPPQTPAQLSLRQNSRKNAQQEGAINLQSTLPPHRFPCARHKLISQSPLRKGAKYSDLTIGIVRKNKKNVPAQFVLSPVITYFHIRRVLRAQLPLYYNNFQRQGANSVRKKMSQLNLS